MGFRKQVCYVLSSEGGNRVLCYLHYQEDHSDSWKKSTGFIDGTWRIINNACIKNNKYYHKITTKEIIMKLKYVMKHKYIITNYVCFPQILLS